jgi:DNA repair and recombination RAD54-like protein
MRRGDLEIKIGAVMPMLSVEEVAAILVGPFKSPNPELITQESIDLRKTKTLGTKRRFFVGHFGSDTPLKIIRKTNDGWPIIECDNPLVLWTPPEGAVSAMIMDLPAEEDPSGDGGAAGAAGSSSTQQSKALAASTPGSGRSEKGDDEEGGDSDGDEDKRGSDAERMSVDEYDEDGEPIVKASKKKSKQQQKMAPPPHAKPPPAPAPVPVGPQPISVDGVVCRWLREHQRAGVQFMFECVAGLKDPLINGCILADDMGLGKTLQSIALLWTLLRQGLDGTPMVKRAIIVCPTSLVANWANELKKWLEGRVRALALCEASKADAIKGVSDFINPRHYYDVLIISYETFRIHKEAFAGPNKCDLLICDEAHRLKNNVTLTNQSLNTLETKRRILLSGTPMQNDLEEFFAMVDFTNPGVLGSDKHFRRHFQNPILVGREPDATEAEKEKAAERSAELSAIVNRFILRRTNTLLSAHLPPKTVEIVCCKMSPLQEELYNHFLRSKAAAALVKDGSGGKPATKVLGSIIALMKLCNHPRLIYDILRSGNAGEAAGFSDAMDLFPEEFKVKGRDRQFVSVMPELSGKMNVLARLLHKLRTETKDRIVLVSNYTQTLDVMAALCRERHYPFLRLDGSTSIGRRQQLVDRLNNPNDDIFVFLLSSKAGGCGLNMIGANRLVLFDPDWNPANDKQAAGRVWRDGQKKKCFIYRFVTTGTIEEKIYQRQLSKEGLQTIVVDSKEEANSISSDNLRDLFTYRSGDRTVSDTHDTLNCECRPGEQQHVQVGHPKEDDLNNWTHHHGVGTLTVDPQMQFAGQDDVTFVFSLEVDGKVVPVAKGK